VDDLSGLIRRQALDAVEQLLHGGADMAQRRNGGARMRGATWLRGSHLPASRGPGEKRTPEQLDEVIDHVYAYIQSNGGQGIEQIAQALNTTTKDLTLPIHKLLGQKKLVSRGQKRATRYFPR
jgi:hypothetical protein